MLGSPCHGDCGYPNRPRLISEANRSFLASLRPNINRNIIVLDGRSMEKSMVKSSPKNHSKKHVYIYMYIFVLEIQVISLISVLMNVCNQLSSVQNLLSFQCTELSRWTKNGMRSSKVIIIITYNPVSKDHQKSCMIQVLDRVQTIQTSPNISKQKTQPYVGNPKHLEIGSPGEITPH